MTAIRSGLVILLCLTLLTTGFKVQAQTPPEFPPKVVAEIQAALDAEVEENDIPGAVLLIDSPRARFAGASGYADLDTQVLLQPDDAFEVGSITKMFTATLVLQLAEKGVLDLDDLLSTWLPDIAASLPNGGLITLRHLLQHTSGLYDVEEDSELVAQYLADPYQSIFEVSAIIDHTAALGAHFAPGAGYHYSSTGYLLLGLVIEAATTVPYAEALRSRIFEPVGMAYTSLETTTVQPVKGYAWDNGKWIDVTDWDRSWAGAGGGLISTPSDLALFIRALFDGDLFANDDTLAQMIDITASGDAGYGLGIQRMTGTDEPVTGWGHGGRTFGYQAMLIYLPGAADIVLVVMTNNSARMPVFDNLLLPVWQYWGVRS